MQDLFLPSVLPPVSLWICPRFGYAWECRDTNQTERRTIMQRSISVTRVHWMVRNIGTGRGRKETDKSSDRKSFNSKFRLFIEWPGRERDTHWLDTKRGRGMDTRWCWQSNWNGGRSVILLILSNLFQCLLHSLPLLLLLLRSQTPTGIPLHCIPPLQFSHRVSMCNLISSQITCD